MCIRDRVKYPRTPEADCRLLEECGAAFVFAPSVEEMYPEPDARRFSYAPLDTVMPDTEFSVLLLPALTE